MDDQSIVRSNPVEIGRDFRTELEVIVGLTGGEMAIVHPGDALPEGTLVQVVSPSAPAPNP